jgi:hypothetical protein
MLLGRYPFVVKCLLGLGATVIMCYDCTIVHIILFKVRLLMQKPPCVRWKFIHCQSVGVVTVQTTLNIQCHNNDKKFVWHKNFSLGLIFYLYVMKCVWHKDLILGLISYLYDMKFDWHKDLFSEPNLFYIINCYQKRYLNFPFPWC